MILKEARFWFALGVVFGTITALYTYSGFETHAGIEAFLFYSTLGSFIASFVLAIKNPLLWFVVSMALFFFPERGAPRSDREYLIQFLLAVGALCMVGITYRIQRRAREGGAASVHE